MKGVLEHMQSCEKGPDCTFTHCRSSRRIISHISACRDSQCMICVPIRTQANLGRQKDAGAANRQNLQLAQAAAAQRAQMNANPNTNMAYANQLYQRQQQQQQLLLQQNAQVMSQAKALNDLRRSVYEIIVKMFEQFDNNPQKFQDYKTVSPSLFSLTHVPLVPYSRWPFFIIIFISFLYFLLWQQRGYLMYMRVYVYVYVYIYIYVCMYVCVCVCVCGCVRVCTYVWKSDNVH